MPRWKHAPPTRCLLFLLALATGVEAHAAPVVHPTRVDPAVRRVIETGILGAFHRTPKGRAHVLLRLARSATPELLAALQAAGAVLTRVRGRPRSEERRVGKEC